MPKKPHPLSQSRDKKSNLGLGGATTLRQTRESQPYRDTIIDKRVKPIPDYLTSQITASLTPRKERRSPMFTMKVMEPRRTTIIGSRMQAILAEEQKEAFLSVQHAVKRNCIFNAHDRTSRSARAASAKASQALKNT